MNLNHKYICNMSKCNSTYDLCIIDTEYIPNLCIIDTEYIPNKITRENNPATKSQKKAAQGFHTLTYLTQNIQDQTSFISFLLLHIVASYIF